MSWQDELRQLDVELAAGRIGHAAHRKKRDELLAEASGGTMPSPVPSPLRQPGGAWHSTNPAARPVELPTVTVQQPQPYQQPYAPPPEQRTQPLETEKPKPREEKKAAIPRIADHKTTAPSPADINPTVYLRAEPPQAQHKPSTRQLNRPLPPLAPEPGPHHSAPAEDHEVVGKRKPTWLFIGAGVLVVLALIIGGTLWLGSSPSSNVAEQPSVAQPPDGLSGLAPSSPPDSAQTPLEDRLPTLPGTPSKDNSTMSVAKGVELNLYSKAAADYLTSKSIASVTYQGSNEGTNGYLVLVIPANDAKDAAAIVNYFRENSLNAGLREQRVGDRLALVGANKNGQLSGIGYVSGTMAVTTWVSQPLGGDSQALDTRLEQTLTSLDTVLPAT
ncbi:hypothetical protein [Amycolatopsis regifaucium]|uniref:Uncharacterized protein n=1 Tax=Amycolatopsis regifaucium TaxID=546365 RepID=A0A154MQ50_9PSEU|nr:hypothetical protein [Amycolatopsis regifaucium]KZB86448.1 hypothetical protein AVL48_27050 [Amycolatopsis regifaucium]OKA06362.1 hypothetical protein ATP06_0224900 [Amycolatopsis regifaucium]SFJ30430.1 hypothetical protein SAMN04489731_118107 [Amycolatopsis regifaucium]